MKKRTKGRRWTMTISSSVSPHPIEGYILRRIRRLSGRDDWGEFLVSREVVESIVRRAFLHPKKRSRG